MTFERVVNILSLLIALSGVVLVLIFKRGNGSLRRLLARHYLGASGSAVLFQCVLAMIGHIINDQRLSNYNGTVPMAVSTALCLSLIGIGFIVLALNTKAGYD